MTDKRKPLVERYALIERHESRTYEMDYMFWLFKVGLHETRMILWIIDHCDNFTDD